MELQDIVLDFNLFFILVCFKGETPYMPEVVKVDKLKFVLEDLNNLLLGEPDKLGKEFGDLRKNLTLCLFLLSTSLGSGPLGLTFTTGRHGGSYSNLGIRLSPKVF